MINPLREKILKRLTVIGIDCTPYKMEEIKQISDDELGRILEAIKSPFTQELHGRYFQSDFYVQATIGLRLSGYATRLKNVKTWQEAEKYGILEDYFAGVGQWPERNNGRKYEYSGDIDDYYNQRGVRTWEQAYEKNELGAFFSGQGFFPQVPRSYKRYAEGKGYEEYIKSLGYEEYLMMLRKYSQHIPARYEKYDKAETFYQTAMCQISRYYEVISKMPEPIYIPGDGIGIGSYVAQKLGKQYYSVEPNPIGEDAVRMGVITKRDIFREDVAECYASVFLGNCYSYFMSEEMMERLRHVMIVIYDENPPLYRGMYPFGEYKAWTNKKEVKSVEREFKGMGALFTYAQEYTLISYDSLSGVLLRYMTNKFDLRGDIKIGAAKVQYIVDYDKNREKYDVMRNRGKQYEFMVRKEMYIISGIVYKIPKYKSMYHVFKQCFVLDKRHAKRGDYKEYKGEIVEWYNNIPFVFDGELRILEYDSYERPTILEHYERNGSELIAKVRNPLAKCYARVGMSLMRIQLMNFDSLTKLAVYKMLADVAYSVSEEENMRDMLWS